MKKVLLLTHDALQHEVEAFTCVCYMWKTVKEPSEADPSGAHLPGKRPKLRKGGRTNMAGTEGDEDEYV